MTFKVLGMATAVPPCSVEQVEAAAFAAELIPRDSGADRLLKTLYRRSGVRRRYSVVLDRDASVDSQVPVATHAGGNDWQTIDVEELRARQRLFGPRADDRDEGPTTARRMEYYEQYAGGLAAEAAARAIQRSGVRAQDITHLVTVSCTGFVAPGVDLALIELLGLPSTTLRTHIGFMGCHGAINGLRVASAFASSDPQSTVLLCAVELCSLHHQYGWHPERIVANSLFADGAGAVVGRESDDSNGGDWVLSATGSCVLENAQELMSWRIGDHGFVMGLSPEVPDVISRRLGPWLEQWLKQQGHAMDQIRSWAIHPGGPRIVHTVAQSLGLTAADIAPSLDVLERYGNMSSPTVFFILEALQKSRARLPCLALAFGPGLSMEVALWDSPAPSDR